MSFTKNEHPYRTCGFSRHIFRTPAWAEVFQKYRWIDSPAAEIGNSQFSFEKTMIFLRLSLKSLIFLWKPMIFLTLSLKSLISIWKTHDFRKFIVEICDFPLETNDFLKMIVQIFDFFWKTDDFLKYRANLWFSFEKQMNFSPGCVMQVCVADRLQIPPDDPLETLGSKNAFASKGYVLKMSLSERPPCSRN